MQGQRLGWIAGVMGLVGGCASSQSLDRSSIPPEGDVRVILSRECRNTDTHEREFVCNPELPTCRARVCDGQEIFTSRIWKEEELANSTGAPVETMVCTFGKKGKAPTVQAPKPAEEPAPIVEAPRSAQQKSVRCGNSVLSVPEWAENQTCLSDSVRICYNKQNAEEFRCDPKNDEWCRHRICPGTDQTRTAWRMRVWR